LLFRSEAFFSTAFTFDELLMDVSVSDFLGWQPTRKRKRKGTKSRTFMRWRE
jgi:hypothetical protein